MINCSTDQGNCSCPGDDRIIGCNRFCVPNINAGVLVFSSHLTIPTLVKCCSRENHRSPTVEHFEIVDFFDSNRKWSEPVISSIPVWCKSSWYVNVGTCIYSHPNIAFSLATGDT